MQGGIYLFIHIVHKIGQHYAFETGARPISMKEAREIARRLYHLPVPGKMDAIKAEIARLCHVTTV